MDTLDDEAISHFIPSVRLTGTREEKLRKLDTLIHHLQQVRDVLAGDAAAHPSMISSYRYALAPWRVFAAGLAAGAAIAVSIGATIRWLL